MRQNKDEASGKKNIAQIQKLEDGIRKLAREHSNLFDRRPELATLTCQMFEEHDDENIFCDTMEDLYCEGREECEFAEHFMGLYDELHCETYEETQDRHHIESLISERSNDWRNRKIYNECIRATESTFGDSRSALSTNRMNWDAAREHLREVTMSCLGCYIEKDQTHM